MYCPQCYSQYLQLGHASRSYLVHPGLLEKLEFRPRSKEKKSTQIHLYIFKIQIDNYYVIRYNIWECVCGYVCEFPIDVKMCVDFLWTWKCVWISYGRGNVCGFPIDVK